MSKWGTLDDNPSLHPVLPESGYLFAQAELYLERNYLEKELGRQSTYGYDALSNGNWSTVLIDAN